LKGVSEFGLAAILVNGNLIKIGTGTDALAAIDTGTTLIGGPRADEVAAIWAAVPGAAPSRIKKQQGYFEFRASHYYFLSLSPF